MMRQLKKGKSCRGHENRDEIKLIALLDSV